MRKLIISICLIIAFTGAIGQTTKAFPDSLYQKYTWKTFLEIPQLHDTLELGNIDLSLLNAAVFYMTNKARTKNRKPAFVFSPALRNMANFHSKEMAKYEFVDHYNKRNPRYFSVKQRSRHFKANARAENVASTFLYDYKSGTRFYRAHNGKDYDFYTMNNSKIRPLTYLEFAEQIVEDWMNSRGHRANILHGGLKTLGCAVRIGTKDMIKGMIPMGYGTQNFGS